MDSADPVINQATTVSGVNRLRKRLPFIAVAVVLLVGVVIGAVLLLRNNAPNGNGNGDELVELTYWGWTVDQDVMDELISDFEAANPGVTVKYEKKAFDDYDTILKSRLESGDPSVAPDVFEVGNENINPLMPYLSTATSTTQSISQTFFPAGAKVCAQNGLVWCYPENFDGLVLVYNANKVPTYWGDFKSWADALTVKQTVEIDGEETVVISKAGAAIGTASNVSEVDLLLWLMMIQNGVPINTSGNLEEMANSDAVAAAELYVSFYEDRIWDKSFTSDISAFAMGKVAVFFGTVNDVKSVMNLNPPFEILTTPPPQVSGQINIAHFQTIAVAATAASTEAAWKWAEYLASSDVQTRVLEADSTRLPARKDLQYLIGQNTEFEGFQAIFMTAEPVFFDDYRATSADTFAAIGAMTLDRRPLSAEDALDELVDGLQ